MICCRHVRTELYKLYIDNKNYVCVCVRVRACVRASVRACVCVCLSRIGGQTAGQIMTKFGTHMWIDLAMVPT